MTEKGHESYMKKFKLIALVIASIMVFSGCSLVRIDQDKVASLVVATVNGTNIYRSDINESDVSYNVQYALYLNNMSERDLTASELKSAYSDQRNLVLDQMVMNELLLQKAAELGITLTDEEKEKNREEADTYFAYQKSNIRADVRQEYGLTEVAEETDATATDETATDAAASSTPLPSPVDSAVVDAEIEARYQEYIDQSGYTPDTYYEELNKNQLIDKVGEYIKKDVVVSDDEAKEWYDQSLATQKEDMDESYGSFASAVKANEIYTYVPNETVAVKQIFLAFDDADLVEEAQTLYNDGNTEAAFALLKSETDALMPTALDIEKQLESGADFDALMAEHGEDDNMLKDEYVNFGYLIEERTYASEPEFNEAALDMTTVGEISEPVVTYTGIHILQCIKIYPAGEVPFDEIKDQIKEALLPTIQKKKYDEITQQWLNEANIVYYRDRLDIEME